MITKYYVSTDQGRTWVNLRAKSIKGAKRAAEKKFPAVLYGSIDIATFDNGQFKRLIMRSMEYNKRCIWIKV